MSYVSYQSWQEVEDIARALRERHIPADVIHVDPGWLRPGMFADLVWDASRFPDPAQHMTKLRQQGFRICLWVQPWVPEGSEMFLEGAANGYFARTATGDVYRYVPTVPGNPPRRAAIVDFTTSEARQWYRGRLRTLIRQGVAAFKTDFGEAIAEDAVFANGMSGRELHNAYPLLYNACFYDAFAEEGVEPLVWGRSGWAGIQRYPVSWSGDQLSNYASMACTLWGGLSFGLSGGAFWSHDIGGYEGRPDAELFIRWAQWGLLSSHSRAHGTTPREPWTFGKQAERVFVDFARLRYRLIPYLHSCAREAAATGLPVMRALVLVYTHDPNAWVADTQYLLGSDLLVCPVLAPAVTSLRIYLPPGLWYDFWSSNQQAGGRWLDVSVGLDSIPVFVRGGAVLILGPEEEWVGQHDGEPLTLLVYPDQAGSAVSKLRHERGETTFSYMDGTVIARGPAPERQLECWFGPGGERIPPISH
jgi:alpha-D-xyloside xylohydrolase